MDLRALLKDLGTFTLGPSVWAILLAALISLTLPLFIHFYIYRTVSAKSLPIFLLVGPSGSGKTSLLTFLEKGVALSTHVSQVPLSVEVCLPSSTVVASSQYRSTNDPSKEPSQRLLVLDTPGHGKLRHYALNEIAKPQHLKGVIFLVDAANISANLNERQEGQLTETAEFLFDVLLALQKHNTSEKSSKGAVRIPVLIGVNKVDLFTALPSKLVKSALESEISRIRNTRTKGLLDSGLEVDEDKPDELDMLGGGGGAGKFEFALMEDYNILVEVLEGNVLGADGADVSNWWNWIGRQL